MTLADHWLHAIVVVCPLMQVKEVIVFFVTSCNDCIGLLIEVDCSSAGNLFVSPVALDGWSSARLRLDEMKKILARPHAISGPPTR